MISFGGLMNQWVISQEERRKHDEQFFSLQPVAGFITGNQAREFFMKSNLPAAVLAQIWDLADLNKDGKMDKREFSIAMHLIQKKLRGVQLPSVLPESLKVDSPVGIPPLQTIIPSLSTSIPSLPTSISSQMIGVPSYPMQQWQPQPAVQPPMTNASVDWTMPHTNRLKYSQQFNSIDKERTGFLAGAHARSIFGRSDVPSETLARIWYLSDLDKDGRLSVDEFCIASYLIDMVKRGASVPASLPPQLLPANWQHGLRLQRAHSVGSDDVPYSPRSTSGDGELIKAPKMTVTFEDKRRQNLERGQAELERRRVLLLEEEKRQRETRDRKQREEHERLEREREEKERTRRLELERQQAKLREEYEKRDREFRQMLEQKEAARKEAERLRKVELEQQRLQELRNQHQREQANIFRVKGKQKNLSLQVQLLSEKTTKMNERVTELRSSMLNSSSSLEAMKGVRDRMVMDIEIGKRRADDLKTRLTMIENEKAGVVGRRRNSGKSTGVMPGSDSYQQMAQSFQRSGINLDDLKRSLKEVEEKIQKKQTELDGKEKSSTYLLDQSRREASEYHGLVQRFNRVVCRLQVGRGAAASASAVTWNNGYDTDKQYSKANTAPYQVVYDFEGVNEDELTLKVGDVVVVFIDHPVGEGWLAGQIGNKVGLFPRDFAVPMGDGERPVNEQPHIIPSSGNGRNREIVQEPEIIQEAPSTYDQVPTGDSSTNQNGSGELYVTVYPFTALEAGDLGFEANEQVLVFQKVGEWWTGRIGDREGVFPANYVQPMEGYADTAVEHVSAGEERGADIPTRPVEQPHESPVVTVSVPSPTRRSEEREDAQMVVQAIAQYHSDDPNRLSLEVGDLVRVRSKSPTGWWEGELQRKGEPMKAGWFPGNYVQVLESDAGGTENGGDVSEPEIVEAIFDYNKQREDELSFTRGATIVILDKMADSWWKGQLQDGQVGLFPANYVKNVSAGAARNDDSNVHDRHHSSTSSTPTSELRKRSMYCQEMEQTEQNYVDDLQMVVDVFYKQMEVSGLLIPKDLSTLFINWMQLLAAARSFVRDLRSYSEDNIGATILNHMDDFRQVFIPFCRHQQSALDFLESKEKASARFRALHAQCSQHPAARGLHLSYFLLIPLARVTKYHLVVKEILKNTPNEHGDYENLQKAHTELRRLCDDVNEVATETENLQTLYWCQNHIKCDSIQPKLVFHSPTNSLGPRRFIHSGILYKAASNRLLIGLLFNDFLMLTTPDEKISQPDTFKLNRNLEISLTLYKTPMLLSKLSLRAPSVQPNGDSNPNMEEGVFSLYYGDSQTVHSETVNVRAVSSNAKTLWVRQLEKAIKVARESVSSRSRMVSIPSAGFGRLLFEVEFVRNLVVPQDCKGASFYIEFDLCGRKHRKSINLTRTSTLCSTQMVLEEKSGIMKLCIFAERTYSPDICVGRTELQLESMLKMSASQRNPAVMQLPLMSDFTPQTDTMSGSIIVKFVFIDVQ